MSSSEEEVGLVEEEEEEEGEEEGEEEEEEGEGEEEEGEREKDEGEGEGEEGEGEEGEGEEEKVRKGKNHPTNNKKKKPLTPGVVFLSRVPPFMRPRKVRHLLSQYGSIGRIYLQPEDPQVRRRRRQFKKNRRRNYTEGWVEFADKRVAKATAMALNNTQIGGKKRYYYHDDIWNMKYLPKFRWHHLTEKIAYEQAVDEQRTRLEFSQLRRETDLYLKNVEHSKQVSAIIDRKKKRGDDLLEHTMRRFKQRKVVDSAPSSSSHPPSSQSTLDDSLLMKIFPGRR